MDHGLYQSRGRDEGDMMTAVSVNLTIAPPGAVCRVCGGACGGQWTQAGASPSGMAWHYHADVQDCLRVVLTRMRRQEQNNV